MSNDRSQPDDVTAIDSLIERAGRTHVIPPREDQSLLDLLREPRVFRRATELLRSKNKEERHRAILCLERIGYVLKDQQTAEVLLQHADRTKDKLEVMTTLDALKNCTPPEPLAAEPLMRLVRRPEWQVWHTAVQCLQLASSRINGGRKNGSPVSAPPRTFPSSRRGRRRVRPDGAERSSRLRSPLLCRFYPGIPSNPTPGGHSIFLE